MEILDGSVVHERWQCYLFLEDVLVFFHVEVFLGSIGCFVDGWHVDGRRLLLLRLFLFDLLI